jgi:hypothetical protein
MTETSYPFASSSIATEDQWSAMMRMAQVDGVFATDPSATDLLVTGSNASTVAVAAGEAWVQGTYYANSASLNVNVPTNSGGGAARKDLIVLRRDPAGDLVSVKYKTGSTSFPTLTQTLNGTWEIPLAQITVAAGASVVAPSGVVDQRWFAGRPAALSNPNGRRPPVKGQLLVEGKTVLLGNGSGYDTLAVAGQDTGWKSITLAAGYATQAAPCGYRVKDGMVTLRGNFEKTSGDLPMDVVTKVATLPIEARPPYTRFGLVPVEWHSLTVGGTPMSFVTARLEVRPDGGVWFLVLKPVAPGWCGLDGFSYSL